MHAGFMGKNRMHTGILRDIWEEGIILKGYGVTQTR
jgi:hypothetical protein